MAPTNPQNPVPLNHCLKGVCFMTRREFVGCVEIDRSFDSGLPFRHTVKCRGVSIAALVELVAATLRGFKLGELGWG